MSYSEANGKRILELKQKRVYLQTICAARGCLNSGELFPHVHPIKSTVPLCRAHMIEAGEGASLPPATLSTPVVTYAAPGVAIKGDRVLVEGVPHTATPVGAPDPLAVQRTDEYLVGAIVDAKKADRDAAQSALAEHTTLLAKTREYRIASQEDCTMFERGLLYVKGQIKELETRRKGVTGPLNSVVGTINAWFHAPVDTLKEIERVVKEKLVAWSREQEIARQAAFAAIDVSATSQEVTTALVQLETAQVQHVSGISSKLVWTFRVIDPTAIPREYLTVDTGLIRAAMNAGIREIPGVVFEQVDQISARVA